MQWIARTFWPRSGPRAAQLEAVAGSLCNRLHGLSDPALDGSEGLSLWAAEASRWRSLVEKGKTPGGWLVEQEKGEAGKAKKVKLRMLDGGARPAPIQLRSVGRVRMDRTAGREVAVVSARPWRPDSCRPGPLGRQASLAAIGRLICAGFPCRLSTNSERALVCFGRDRIDNRPADRHGSRFEFRGCCLLRRPPVDHVATARDGLCLRRPLRCTSMDAFIYPADQHNVSDRNPLSTGALLQARENGEVLVEHCPSDGLGWVEVPPFTAELNYAESLLPEGLLTFYRDARRVCATALQARALANEPPPLVSNLVRLRRDY